MQEHLDRYPFLRGLHPFLHHEHFLELDFVLKCLNSANRILKEHAGAEPDWGAYDELLVREFDQILEAEMSDRAKTALDTGQEKKVRKPPISSRGISSPRFNGEKTMMRGPINFPKRLVYPIAES